MGYEIFALINFYSITFNNETLFKESDRMPYYVYMILCEGNNFYTGYTKDLDLRMKLHTKGKGATYTRMHRPRKIVHVEQFDSRAEAMRREKSIKRLKHNQKAALARNKPK
jgi:putative endonuclease